MVGYQERERPQEKMSRLSQRIWENLRSAGLLERILSNSEHADEASAYTGVKFWSEIGGHDASLILQILIEHLRGNQPVTPKLYRINSDHSEQKRLSEQIWDGVTEDDVRFIAEQFADNYYERDHKNWLSPEQSRAIRTFYPSIKSGNVKIELVPEYAQFKITPR